jgi:hypothetical protein
MSLHHTEKLYNNLGRRPDENLALATTLSIDDVVLSSNSITRKTQNLIIFTHKAVVL